MLTIVVIVNSACLAAVALLWQRWRQCPVQVDGAAHFATVLAAAREHEAAGCRAEMDATC